VSQPELFAEIVQLLRTATGEDAQWAAAVGPQSRLDGDLFFDSLELVALGELLVRHFGDRVDLAAFVAELDLDQLMALTVDDLVSYVLSRRDRTETDG